MSATVVPAVTDATFSDERELREAASHFLKDLDSVVFRHCDGGVNNKCYYVSVKNQAAPSTAMTSSSPSFSYVLRIYNNGLNTPRVLFEHRVLELLKKQSHELTFQIPTLVPTLTHASQSYALLSTGAAACLFERIPGTVGDPIQSARSIGTATARLTQIMSRIPPESIGVPCPNPLYRNIYDAHHAMSRNAFFEVISSSSFDHVSQARDDLVREVHACEELVEKLVTLPANELPSQLIHADLHFLNVLCMNEEVSGILDFEFSAIDWRCMELVVGLSKYVGVDKNQETIQVWIDGYYQANGRLTEVEISYIPELIILRIISNVVYFVGRAYAKEDSIDALTTRAEMYANRCKWIREKRDWLIQCLSKLKVA